MSKSPVVLIHSNTSIDSLYDGIQDMLNAKYHSGGLACDPSGKCTPSDKELTELASLSSFAAHASDNLHVNGVHIERLIR